MIDFTTEYYPDVSEISDEALATAREAVVAYLSPEFDDIDLSPGTPTGDLVVSPLAAYRAAGTVGMNRLLSDLDLANVADGLIYSCDFVKAYLGNFGVYDVENFSSTGVARLVFQEPTATTLSKAIRFNFGTDDEFYPKMASQASNVTILAAGASYDGSPDTYVLSQTSTSTWAVDIPVEATMTAPVEAGATGTASLTVTDLVGVASAIDFMEGVGPTTLSGLAFMARKLASALTSGSRASMHAMAFQNWPELSMVSAIVTGDSEMQRMPASTAIALQPPSVDLYVRSKQDMTLIQQTIRMDYMPDPEGSGDYVFRAAAGLLHNPSLIDSVEWVSSTTESYVTSYTTYTQSASADIASNEHCGTRYENLFIEVVPVVDGGGSPLISLSEETVGMVTTQYAMFTVSYYCDPVLTTVANTIESPDYKPVGVSTLVKSGPLANIEVLEISFKKSRGYKTALTAARTNLVDYINNAGEPQPFRVTEIHDILKAAGADYVTDIYLNGSISPTAATKILDIAVVDNTELWLSNSHAVVPVSFDGVAEMHTSILAGPTDSWAATTRTLKYHIKPANINFIEV